MYQRLLMPLKCTACKNEYYETGYWHDGELCPACSTNLLRQEDERKKEVAREVAKISEKYGLDLGEYPGELPEEIRQKFNPRNAGRKPVKWEDALCELLVDRAAEGKVEAEFAAEMHVSQAMIQHWTEVHPRFKAAREVANQLREAWFEKHYRLGMLGKIEVVPSMMIRLGAARYGLSDKSETTLTGPKGEIPVVKMVERDSSFPSETLEPTAEQAAAAAAEMEKKVG